MRPTIREWDEGAAELEGSDEARLSKATQPFDYTRGGPRINLQPWTWLTDLPCSRHTGTDATSDGGLCGKLWARCPALSDAISLRAVPRHASSRRFTVRLMVGLRRGFARQRMVSGFFAARRAGLSVAWSPVFLLLNWTTPGCDGNLELFDAAPPDANTQGAASAVNRFMVLHVENDASQVQLAHPHDTMVRVTPRVAGEWFINPDDLRQSTGVLRWQALATPGDVTSLAPTSEVTLRFSKVESASVRRLADLRPNVSERAVVHAVLETAGETRAVNVELLLTADIRDGQLSGVGLELSRPLTLPSSAFNARAAAERASADAGWEMSGRVVARASAERDGLEAKGR